MILFDMQLSHPTPRDPRSVTFQRCKVVQQYKIGPVPNEI